MQPNVSLGDGLGVAGTAMGTASSTPLVTGAVDVSKWAAIIFIFRFGDMANETIDAGVQTCDSDGTSNAVNITGKQITQLAASASANDSKIAVVAIVPGDTAANNKSFVRGRIVTGSGTGGTCSIIALGVPKYGPADLVDVTDVVQVVK